MPHGLTKLGLAEGRDALLYIPRRYGPAHPAPLLVMLHGAGGQAAPVLSQLQPWAEGEGVLLLAPESRKATWDIIAGDSLGPDVAFMDLALARTFAQVAVDAERLAIGGFSDGASYALCLGLSNGDLFRTVLAFSPGFLIAPAQVGSPRIFISHGIADRVLPIGSCSRRLVPALRLGGYEVHYREFNGGHEVPAETAAEAGRFFLQGDPPEGH